MLRARVAAAIQAAGEKTQASLTQDVRLRAVDMGWPTAAATRVNVHHTGAAFSATFDGAEDWEFGTEDRPPMPVARGFEATSHVDHDDAFMDALANELSDLL